MADSIIEKGNRLARNLYREKTMEGYIVAKTQYDMKKAELDSADKVLTELRLKSGIIEFSQQTREISRAYYTSILNKSNNVRLEDMFHKLQQYGSDYVTLNEKINYTRSVFNNYKQYVENAEKDLTKELSYSNVVTPPMIPDKKAYPLRSLIMLMFTASDHVDVYRLSCFFIICGNHHLRKFTGKENTKQLIECRSFNINHSVGFMALLPYICLWLYSVW